MSTATAPKLTKPQAVKLHDAEVEVQRARAALEGAEAARQELRERYLDRVPLSDDPEEAAKGIRKVEVAGIKVRVAPQVSGDFFRLSDFLKAGHKLTPQMREHVSPGKPFDRWTVRGPAKRSDAIEVAR